ncbi:MAG: thioredoxin-dependent thiol peroxidase [Rickettsiales bacterium]|nr:thioredoxin-dependent thiol peroxidase [Rickettsiales bacterium]
MVQIEKGNKYPDSLSMFDDGQERFLKEFAGRNLVLYFYPKDDTPGCTQEAKDFRDHLEEFKKLNAVVIGVSKDDVVKHKKFKEKYDLTFQLISDTEGKMCANYGVWAEKSMYGKKYFGIERSTFLIDKEGKIVKIWRNVSVKGHVAEVINELKELR